MLVHILYEKKVLWHMLCFIDEGQDTEIYVLERSTLCQGTKKASFK